MKKSLFLFLTIIFILTGCSNNQNLNNYSDETNLNFKDNNINNHKEEIIASFSTTILDKDSARQNNIRLACNQLNDTIVKHGQTFSFCDTLGPATPENGYQEADTYDR